MAGLFDRIHVWLDLETVHNQDLNAEFDNIINNLGANLISGWSATAAEMRIQTNPGTFNAENLSTSISDEIERLRYQISQLIGGPNSVWYDNPVLSMSQINLLLTPGGVPANRISSGRIATTSNQPMHLVPAGSGATCTLKATATPFEIYIDGTKYTFTTDITSGTLGQPVTSNNTFALNDANCDLSTKTKCFGAFISDLNSIAAATPTFTPFSNYDLIGGTCGSSIASLANTYQAFKYSHGGATEYFIGFINSATNGGAITITKAFRGFFFDSSDTALPAIALNNAENVTLMKLGWVFVDTSGSLIISYNAPRYSSVAPSTSANGDMWYDLVNNQWNISNGSTFSRSHSGLVGIVVTDGTNCVAARSFDWFRTYKQDSNVSVEWYSATEFRSKRYQNNLNVYGTQLNFEKDAIRWISTDVDSDTTLSASNTYYLYLSDTGTPKISKVPPHKRFDIGGYYHPHKSWRCLSLIYYNATPAFDQNIFVSVNQIDDDFINDRSLSVSKRRLMNVGASVLADGYARSTSSGSFSTSSTSYVDATNLSINITTTGRPVFLKLAPTPGDNASNILIVNPATVTTGGTLAFLRAPVGSTGFSVIDSIHVGGGSGTAGVTLATRFSPSSINATDPVGAGAYTYKVQALTTSAATAITLNECQLEAFEI